MKLSFSILGCIVLALLFFVVFRLGVPTRSSAYASELGDLHQIQLELREYAEEHNGSFPSLETDLRTDKMKSVQSFISIMKTDNGTQHAFLYFPGRKYNPEGVKEIIGASIETYSLHGRSVRCIMYSDGTASVEDENKFAEFLLAKDHN